MEKETLTEENQQEKDTDFSASQAIALCLLEEYEKAEEAFDSLSKEHPDNIDFWTNKQACLSILNAPDATFFNEMLTHLDSLPSEGLLCIAKALISLDRNEEALVFLNKTLEFSPENIEACEQKYILLEKLEKEEELYAFVQTIYPRLKKNDRILCLAASYAGKHSNINQAKYLLKKAFKINEPAVRRNPFFYDALFMASEEKKALKYVAEEIQKDGKNPNLWRIQAEAFYLSDKFKSASDSYKKLNLLTSLSDKDKFNWSDTLFYQERHKEAFDLLLSLDLKNFYLPIFLASRECLIAMKEKQTKDIFLSHLERWREKWEETESLSHVYAGLAEEDKQTRMPPSLIEVLNDNYSSETLNWTIDPEQYHGRAVLEKALNALDIPVANGFNVLDLGCGIGILSEVLKNYSYLRGSITGVDLSTFCLTVAQQTERYANLVHEDVLSYVETCSETYNLISCIDVLQTFSDLTELFQSVYDILEKDGVFVFTTSALEKEIETDFKLLPIGNFIHNKTFVLNCLQEAGLNVLLNDKIILRTINEEETYANIFVVQRNNL